MAEGRSISTWGPTGELMALIANVNRDPNRKREPFEAADFNPHIGKREKPRETISLKDAFKLIGGKPAAEVELTPRPDRR